MRIHFANSAWVHARENQVLRGGRRQKLKLPVRYGIIEHPEQGVILVDTGYGPTTTSGRNRSFWLKFYNRCFGPELISQNSPEHVLNHLGYSLADVRKVIITHCHPDHISEIALFPHAEILMLRSALDKLRSSSTRQLIRYGVFPELLPRDLENRVVDIDILIQTAGPLSLGHCRDLLGDGSMLAVDLPGHADGHFGICFPMQDPPLLYATDTQWLLSALTADRLPGFPASLIATNPEASVRSVALARKFEDAGGQLMLCHDPNPTSYDLAQLNAI